MAKDFVQNDRLVALLASGVGAVLVAVVAFGDLPELVEVEVYAYAKLLLAFAPVAIGRSILDKGDPSEKDDSDDED